MENKFKTNDQLSPEFYDLISLSYAEGSLKDTKRVLENYRTHIGRFPPTTENAIQHLNRFKDRSLNTRSRYVTRHKKFDASIGH